MIEKRASQFTVTMTCSHVDKRLGAYLMPEWCNKSITFHTDDNPDGVTLTNISDAITQGWGLFIPDEPVNVRGAESHVLAFCPKHQPGDGFKAGLWLTKVDDDQDS